MQTHDSKVGKEAIKRQKEDIQEVNEQKIDFRKGKMIATWKT